MYKGKKILAIIPARGGSKGLPKKNIRKLMGKPLICWTIEQAQRSSLLDCFFVSTDSAEIADVCERECGVKVEQLRPAELAQDGTSSADVIKYTIELLEGQGKTFDYVVLLEPTSPLRKGNDIDDIIRLACENPQSDGVISAGDIHMEHPIVAKKVNDKGFLVPYMAKHGNIYQRQQMDRALFPYGVAYMIKTDVFLREMSLYTDKIIPYFMERWQGYEVDDIYDLICIEAILKYREEMK